MTAYDLMCKRNKFQDRINYLKSNLENNTEIVLLSNDEIEEFIDSLEETLNFIDIQLSKIKIE